MSNVLNKTFLHTRTKRVLDIVVAVCALVVTGPLILLGALLVKITSRGPAFYRAKRAGLSGQPFAMFKLRTMHLGSNSPDRRITADEDRRVTALGGWRVKHRARRISFSVRGGHIKSILNYQKTQPFVVPILAYDAGAVNVGCLSQPRGVNHSPGSLCTHFNRCIVKIQRESATRLRVSRRRSRCSI